MSVRVVVYAEGTRELRATRDTARKPPELGQTLIEDYGELGPAHVLVRRTIEAAGVPPNAVHFDQGHRTIEGRFPRGSDLTRPRILVPLMTWFPRGIGPEAPDLAVVFVDCDAEPGRYEELKGKLASLDQPPTRVVAVAVQEFEAWLIADDDAVNEVLGSRLNQVAPETLERGAAKELLEDLLNAERAEARTAIAKHLDLEKVRQICPSFARFVEDIEAALREISEGSR